MIKNQGIFDRSKNTFDQSRFGKTEILKNNRSFMQKTLKPIDFMNEMHEYEFKSFSKT